VPSTAGKRLLKLGQERRARHRLEEERIGHVATIRIQLEMRVPAAVCSPGVASNCNRHGAHAEEQLGEHRRDQQEAERMGDLSPWGRWAGTGGSRRPMVARAIATNEATMSEMP